MAGNGRSWRKFLLGATGLAVVLFVLIQFVPYGRSSHSNPAVTNPFRWTDPRAEAIARTSCYDCHSNETKWWWATNIAPFSWLVQHDVDDGRARLNFSEYTGEPPVDELRRVVAEGEMPPLQYTVMHADAKLSDAQKQALIQGYQTGVVASGGASTGGQPGATPSARPAGVAEQDAVAIINQRCTSCHPADPALSFRAGSTSKAQALTDAMVQRGAQVTAAEQQVLARYFTR